MNGTGLKRTVGSSSDRWDHLGLVVVMMPLGGCAWSGARLRTALRVTALALVCVVSLAVTSGARANIYWTTVGNPLANTGDTIATANWSGSVVNENFITGARNPLGPAVDGSHIYWANLYSGSIGRANLDGSGVNQDFITGLSNPLSVAVDGAHIYWTGDYGIGRANLDGSGVDDKFLTMGYPYDPISVAVDSAHIYWATQWADTIGESDLNGAGVNQYFTAPWGFYPPSDEFITGITVAGGYIYWTYTYGIGRKNLATGGYYPKLITGLFVPQAVAVDPNAGHVYWTAVQAPLQTGAIGRADLNGQNVTQNFINTGNWWPVGIAVDVPISGGGQTMPTSKDQCMNDGWRHYPGFKNQGDCVNYVATHGKYTPGR